MHKNCKSNRTFSAMLLVTAVLMGGILFGSNRVQARAAEYPAAAPQGSKTYFFENFRNYGVKAPLLVDDPGIKLSNDPIYARMAQGNISLSKSRLVMREYSPAKLPANLLNYDVLFRFRLQETAGQLGHFELRLRGIQNGKVGDIIVGIASNEVKFSSEGLTPAVKGAANLPFEITKNEWHQAAVTVRNGQLAVFIDDDRVLRQVAQTKILALPSAGINFYGFQESTFGITDITLRDPALLPNNSIFSILPTPQKVNEADFKKGATQTVVANDIFGAIIRTGEEKNAVKMTIGWNDGKTNEITFTSVGAPDQRKVKKDGKDVTEKFERPDAIILVSGINGDKSILKYYVRPLLKRYKSSYSVTDTYRDIVRDWDLLPAASEHPLKVELRRTQAGVDVYLDGRYAGSIAGASVKDVQFAAAPTASVGETFSFKAPTDASKYLPLEVASLGMAKSFVDVKPSIKPGLSEIKNVPMFVASGTGSADLGLIKEGQGNWALEVDEYLARSPFDGFLSEVHFTVPGGVPYTKAWVLAAVDPDASKDAVFTARLTHYVENGIGGNLIADTTITLPRGSEKPGKGVTQVGTIPKVDKNGKTVAVPLYLVEVPLNSGKILDQFANPSMDFEFLGKLGENFEQLDNTMKPDPDSVSAVQILGATLEKSPVGMDLVQSQPGNIFANDDKPETSAVLKSLAPSAGKITWEVSDKNGIKVGDGAEEYSFSKTGEEKQIDIPLKMPELGWYRLLISVQDQNGNTLFTHPASFALLGKDERKARYESPYATWWFDGVGNSPKDIDFAGPIMFKAGIRKASATRKSEADMAKYFITIPQFPKLFNFADLDNVDAALKKNEVTLRAEIEKYPHAREILFFHESGPGNDIPMELIGLKPDNQTPDQIVKEKRYADLLNLAGPFFREKFPQLKIVVGNNSSSASNIAAILRQGGNPDYIDYIGIESASQVFTPEKLQEYALQGMHITTDTAKVLSGRDIPATGTFEFTYRCERDMGVQKQAQWYTRDALISLANNFTTISPGTLFDVSNAYYQTAWGASGMLERAPYGYPKPAYVAYATLTNVLDQVKLHRQIPTGSTTVYAVEFDRADKKLATALWASRGDVDFDVLFSGDTPVEVVDMYGHTRELKTTGGKLTVNAGVNPVYLIAEKEIKTIMLGSRSFPEDDARAKLSNVAAPFDNINSVKMDTDNSLDTLKTFPLQTPIRQLGDFDLRQVVDDQKGNCLELQLNMSKNPNLSKYITEYTTIRLKSSLPVSGDPAALGVWVKGNSNWGRVMFEIEDAQGEVWRSIGTAGWGVDILDWPGNLAVNFDGWNFVSLPLHDTKLFNDHSPGAVLEQWVSSGGDKKIDFPIKVRALTIEMNRNPLDLTDFKEAKPLIRLKNISEIYDTAKGEVTGHQVVQN